MLNLFIAICNLDQFCFAMFCPTCLPFKASWCPTISECVGITAVKEPTACDLSSMPWIWSKREAIKIRFYLITNIQSTWFTSCYMQSLDHVPKDHESNWASAVKSTALLSFLVVRGAVGMVIVGPLCWRKPVSVLQTCNRHSGTCWLTQMFGQGTEPWWGRPQELGPVQVEWHNPAKPAIDSILSDSAPSNTNLQSSSLSWTIGEYCILHELFLSCNLIKSSTAWIKHEKTGQSSQFHMFQAPQSLGWFSSQSIQGKKT